MNTKRDRVARIHRGKCVDDLRIRHFESAQEHWLAWIVETAKENCDTLILIEAFRGAGNVAEKDKSVCQWVERWHKMRTKETILCVNSAADASSPISFSHFVRVHLPKLTRALCIQSIKNILKALHSSNAQWITLFRKLCFWGCQQTNQTCDKRHVSHNYTKMRDERSFSVLVINIWEVLVRVVCPRIYKSIPSWKISISGWHPRNRSGRLTLLETITWP